jgi:hypothetical protein
LSIHPINRNVVICHIQSLPGENQIEINAQAMNCKVEVKENRAALQKAATTAESISDKNPTIQHFNRKNEGRVLFLVGARLDARCVFTALHLVFPV